MVTQNLIDNRPRLRVHSEGVQPMPRGVFPMAEMLEFSELLTRARAGDEDACEHLFQRYHKVFYRTISIRLENSALQGVLDVEDVCQTVFKSFFCRLGLGQFELESEKDLVNLLLRMAHNKLTAKKRRQQTRPEVQAGVDPGDVDVAGRGHTPSQVLAYRELFQKAQEQMSDEERALHQLRIEQKLAWDVIATQLGGTAEGRRKQWERTAERIAQALELDA